MKRYLYDKLYRHLGQKPFTIIIGARQTGKTTLLKQLYETLLEEGKRAFFFNMERRDLRAELNEQPLKLLSYLPKTMERKYVFIDEVQYLNDPSNFLKLLYDEYSSELKIIATGSSAFYIDRKFKDSLAGRKRIFVLMTCSFEEYLDMKGEKELLSEFLRVSGDKGAKTTRLTEIEAELDDYIIYGGYPRVVCEDDADEKIELLKELRDSYLQRDIEEAGIKDTDSFYKLYTLLAASVGTEINISELSKTIRVSGTNIEKYLYILQKSFHIALVRPFYRNVKKELVKMPKAFLLDTGMRNCLINYYPKKLGLGDDGALFENFVYHRLREKFDGESIKYWRTADQKEVDFVIDGAQEKAAYEVKYNNSAVKPKKYKLFSDNYPEYGLSFISKEPFTEERIETLRMTAP